MNTDFRFWGFCPVCKMFANDVSGAAVVPIFNDLSKFIEIYILVVRE